MLNSYSGSVPAANRGPDQTESCRLSPPAHREPISAASILLEVYAEQRPEALDHRGDSRTREVDLPIEGHQELDRLKLGIVRGELSAFMDKFIGKVFNCMA